MVKIPAYIDDIHILGSHMEHVDIFYIDTFYFFGIGYAWNNNNDDITFEQLTNHTRDIK